MTTITHGVSIAYSQFPYRSGAPSRPSANAFKAPARARASQDSRFMTEDLRTLSMTPVPISILPSLGCNSTNQVLSSSGSILKSIVHSLRLVSGGILSHSRTNDFTEIQRVDRENEGRCQGRSKSVQGTAENPRYYITVSMAQSKLGLSSSAGSSTTSLARSTSGCLGSSRLAWSRSSTASREQVPSFQRRNEAEVSQSGGFGIITRPRGTPRPQLSVTKIKRIAILEDHALLMSRTGMIDDTIAPSACVIGGVIVYLVGRLTE